MAKTTSLGDAVLRIRADVSRFGSDMRMVKSMAIASLGMQGIRLATDAIGAFGRLSINVMGDVRDAIISTNAQFERMSVTFGAMMKDARAGDLMAERVESMAAKTPFSSESLMKGVQLLKNYGMETKKILPAMEAIGNAAAAAPAEMQMRVSRIALAIGQMKSQGKLMGQEMRQLAEAGVGAQDILQKAFKATIPEIQKAIKSGAISIDDVIDELLKGMNKQFEGVMEKQSRTWDGLWERMADKSAIAIRQITGGLFKEMKGGLEFIVDMFDSPEFSKFISMARNGIQSLVQMLRQVKELLAPIGTQLVNSFQILKPLVIEIIDNLSRLEGVSGVFERMRDVALTAISGMTIGFREILDIVSLLTVDLGKTWELFSVMAEIAFNSIAARIDHFFSYWGTAIQNAGTMMVNVFTAAFAELTNFASAFTEFFGKGLSIAIENLGKQIAAIAQLPSDIQKWGLDNATGLLRARQDLANKDARDKTVSAAVDLKNALNPGAAAARVIADAMKNVAPIPQFKEPGRNQELRDRALGLVQDMMKTRDQRRTDRGKKMLNDMVGGIIGDGMKGFGAAIKGGAGGLVGAAAGIARGVAGKMHEEKEVKKAKAEFVGIAELSKKIQLGLANSEEDKDRKKLIAGVGMVEKAVEGVKGGVKDVVGAIKNWIPKAS